MAILSLFMVLVLVLDFNYDFKNLIKNMLKKNKELIKKSENKTRFILN